MTKAQSIEQQIKAGCERLIHESAQTSKCEPSLAIAQLLLAAATLGKTVGMRPKDFEYGVSLAMNETFYRAKSAA
jgi:hypothetical protein